MNLNLILDLDGPICPTCEPLIDFMNKKLNKKVRFAHYTEFRKVYNLTPKEESEIFDEFARRNIAGTLTPTEGSIDVIREFVEQGDTAKILTARPRPTYGFQTMSWVEKYLSNLIKPEDVVMFEGLNEIEQRVSKSENFQKMKGDVFVDDSLHHVVDVQKNNPNALVIYKYISGKLTTNLEDLPAPIIPVTTWREIRLHIYEYKKQKKKLLVS